MKKRILTLALVLSLLVALVIPASVALATTVVTGNVVQGSTFSAPSAIPLGNMTPGTPATGLSSDGSLVGNNPTGYTVTAIDSTGVPPGYMTEPVGPTDLTNKLDIGPSASPIAPLTYGPADVAQMMVDTSGITNVPVSLYVSQLATISDPAVTGYIITITFTVVPKP